MSNPGAALPLILRRLAARRFFSEPSPRTRALVNQAPLTAAVMLIALLAQGFHPELLRESLFQLSVVLHLALFAACAIVPWQALPRPAVLAIPMLDFLPIALLREASVDVLAAPGTLVVIPVIWLTGSGLFPAFCLAASFIGPLLIVVIPLWAAGVTSVREFTEVLVLPFVTFALGVAVTVISAARQKEELLLNVVLDTVGVGVVVLDRDGSVLLTNERQRRTDALATPSTDEDLVRRAADGEVFSEQLVWVGAEDRRRAFSVSAYPITNGDQRDGAVITYTDVTELLAGTEAKEAFLSNISHELRTPLTSILGYLEVLQDETDLPHQIARNLHVIERNAQRLERLVSDLLAVSSGSVDVRPEPADIAEVVQLSLATAAPRAALAGVELITDIEQPLPAVIDPIRVSQVLDNLLSNAIKYSSAGGKVRVSAKRVDDTVVCSVTDDGIGMTEDEQRRVFNPFFRGHTARNAAIPGVGLGLAISRQIVENHAGTITSTSTLGAGSTFTIALPAPAGP